MGLFNFLKKNNKKDTTMTEILNDFEKYLEDKGYSKLTPSGNPSTTHDYSQRRIPAIISREGISLNRLIKDISIVISKYDSFGSESDYGNKSNRAYINALKRFEEYIQSEYYSKK